MATSKSTGNADFIKFLSGAPTLDEVSAQDTTELSGIVSRTTDGKFAITTADGQTYELETNAVQQFRAEESAGFSKVATIQVSNEGLKSAAVRPIKPLTKDLPKDPIKEMIHDGKHLPIDTLTAKDVGTDAAADKALITDPGVDPIGTGQFKDVHTDPLIDPIGTIRFKDVGTDPIQDQVKDFLHEGIFNPVDPTARAGLTPFAIATQHHAPAQLLAMQMGAAQPASVPGSTPTPKPLWGEKLLWREKYPWADVTFKEIIHDPMTFWEQPYDPWKFGQGPVTNPMTGAQGMGI